MTMYCTVGCIKGSKDVIIILNKNTLKKPKQTPNQNLLILLFVKTETHHHNKIWHHQAKDRTEVENTAPRNTVMIMNYKNWQI